MNPSTFNPGESARVRQSIHSPYSGQTGIVLDFDPSDNRGAYLVIFSDGLQFRYRPQELEPLNRIPKPRVLGSLFRGLHIR
jgi:hypothetical protein